MSSIEEIFKTYADYATVPVIGIIDWTSKLAPDNNICVVFIFNYAIMAFSFTGYLYTAMVSDAKWTKK